MSYVNKEFEFPAELLVHPQALIGVIGLDTLNNALHKATWDAMCNHRRSDRSPVQFKFFPPTHEFPKPKAKKAAYELHIPKGILKRNWMHKHLTQIPAVIVIFYDLDWDDPDWEEKKSECVSRVRSIRASLEGRNCKICLVLIQKTAPLPSGEDVLGTERANTLYQAAELGYKALFILPHTEHLLGYTSNLEKAFYDLAVSYYQMEMRSVKSHRENMNKTTHQYLYVRHQFKLGFFSELKQDLNSAHAYYSEAYSNLLEVRLSDTNEFEVKTVAGYIDYKVCRVLFCQNKPRDAISHFKAHIEHYKQKRGHAHLLFQHFAWLSKQYNIFADLFDEMIHQGLPAAQTQHPGFYYHQAAKYAIQRKEFALQLCSGVTTYPEPDPLVGWDRLEYYGQRAWRPCKLSAEPLDPDMERLGIIALQFVERATDISSVIIGLLGSAISQFKTYRCFRMRRRLIVQMAEEYFNSREYGKALTLVMHMLYDYRQEQWYLIGDKLLKSGLASSYLTASVTDYIQLCVEGIGRFNKTPEASRIMNNLIQVIQGQVPDKEPEIPCDEETKAKNLWLTAKSSSPVFVDMSLFPPPVQLKAVIEKHEYDSIVIKIVIRSILPEEFQFDCLKLCVTCATQAREHVVARSEDLLFKNGEELKEFSTTLTPHPQDIGKTLQITSVLLTIGNLEGRSAFLKFTGLGTDPTTLIPELSFFKLQQGIEKEFSKVKPCLTCVVSRRPAEIDMAIDSEPPAIFNEWYPIRVRLKSRETSTATVAVFSFGISQGNDCEVEDIETRERFSLPLTFSFGDIEPGATFEKGFIMKISSMESRTVDIKVSYAVDGNACLIESNFKIDVIEGFTTSIRYLGLLRFEPLDNLYEREAFNAELVYNAQSVVPITIHSSYINISPWLKLIDDYYDSFKGLCMRKDEVAQNVVSLLPVPGIPKSEELGEIVLVWAREGEKATTETKIKLPPIEINETPLTVVMKTGPSLGTYITLLPVTYTLTNHSHSLITLSLVVEASPSFMFAGHKQMVLYLQPKSSKDLRYCLYPLYCGVLALPKLKLSQIGDNPSLPNLTALLDRTLHSTMYIMPKAKGQPEEENLAKPAIT